MKVAVTGASGFIGRALCAALGNAGHEVARIDLRCGQAPAGDTVVHLAAIAHRRASADEIERVNVELAREVGRKAAAQGSPMVYVSSVKVHGETSEVPVTENSPLEPQDVYGASKVRAEAALRAIPGLRLAVLRPPLVYGPGVKANFLALLRAVDLGLPLPFASVLNRRSLVYVGNVASAILACMGKTGTFLVSDGPGLSIGALCRAMGKALGRPARLFPFPGACLPAKLAASLEVDDSAIRTAVQWRPPFTFEDGLRDTVAWYRAR